MVKIINLGAIAQASLLALGACTTLVFSSAARADDAPEPSPSAAPSVAPAPAAPTSRCTLRGTSAGPKDARLYDAAEAGRELAIFTGAVTPLSITEIPADPSKGRAKVTTHDSDASMRIEGYAEASAFEVFTTRDVPVVTSHVWVTAGRRVRLTRASADELGAELLVAGSDGQTVKIQAPCDAFALAPARATPMDVPGKARGYTMKTSAITLYDAPGGSAIFQVRMSPSAAQLFWSTETKKGMVHVLSRTDLTIDAWAKASELEALKRGEMMDQLAPPIVARAGARLHLEGDPVKMRASQAIPIRALRDAKAPPIGAIEAGAEVYALETIGAWMNVLPTTLAFMPPDGYGLWIEAAQAPKAEPKPAAPAEPKPAPAPTSDL